MLQNDRLPLSHHEHAVSAANPANHGSMPLDTVQTLSPSSSPGSRKPVHAVTPTQSFDSAASKQPAIREALALAGYLGDYTLAPGFNLPMFQHNSSELQEIHLDIDIRRPSAALRTALARALFPVPGVVHARGEREYALPIIAPEGSKMEESEYWALAVKEGIYKGDFGSHGRPSGAPPFQRCDIEEDEVKKGVWSSLKCW
ncbi:hypothetical protein FPV67DRAFT_1452938 [Lyophyllum atratum]|nr:hypothetical protein FPV67DRAFT_1452938 [Lyophyllum atratum]